MYNTSSVSETTHSVREEIKCILQTGKQIEDIFLNKEHNERLTIIEFVDNRRKNKTTGERYR